MNLLELDSVTKEFPGPLTVLRDISLTVTTGEVVWLRGPSGTGKTTLLSLAGLLAEPTSGAVRVCGSSSLADAQAARTRRERIGFVFQKPVFFPALNTVENVALPSLAHRAEALTAAAELLDRFGVANRAVHRTALLSGGEAQRVALARALINDPQLLLADEPTAGLDDKTGDLVRKHLAQMAAEGRGVLVASHDGAFGTIATRTIELREGELS
ncbi:ATP-binding cassette domain-containing protein [Streptomyces sp. 549]|uniref:ABC transporter ATP-binding protein n=1 Tax=Streptomyces sp. 549 TaxID=3049076 RepID=UPI0024C42AE7|nr:ATP-binding cassette domain-containing protein [Streptomyces sp. 549]MDK1475992.1 ATP-binding cassette domain-containing protein [Streptomyces sp. 549]